MSLENFSSFASCLNEISQSVRKITLNKSNLENNYKIKTDDSPVTKYDIEAENYIRKYIEDNFGKGDGRIKFASLVTNKPSEIIVDYHGYEINKDEVPSWIVFPWEEWSK